MPLHLSLEEILGLLEDIQVSGNTTEPITNIKPLLEAQIGDLSFLGNNKYRQEVPKSRASVILLPKEYEGDPCVDQVYVRTDAPTLALGRICEVLEKQLWPTPEPGIHPSAIVEPGTTIAPTAYIGPNVYVGKNTTIGERTRIEAAVHIGQQVTIGADNTIHPRAVLLDYNEIGNRVIIQSGAIIGSEGFGYVEAPEGIRRLPQIGRVVLEDEVSIGANTTIDRARFGETRIGAGTKIDNLVQIGHNVQFGKNCIVISQVGVSGSTTLGDGVILGGQAGLAGHLHVGDGSKMGAQSGLNHDLSPNSYVRGTPAQPFVKAQKTEVLSRRLPELYKRVEQLEKQLSSNQDS